MNSLDPAHPRFADLQALRLLRDAPELIDRVTAMRLGEELAAQKQLRQSWPEELVRGAFALVDARRRGAAKFRLANQMWFERKGLEQSTPEPVARHKAKRFSGEVLDLCCGIGGDALAQAERCQVTAVDLDPCACLRAEWNTEVYGVAPNVSTVCGDVTQFELTGKSVHLDPDRRQSGQKAVRIEDYIPGPDFITRLMGTARGGAVKLSPAANFVGRFPDAEIELISLNGECKEATVWFGDLMNADPWRATVLPAGESLAGNPLEHVADLAEPRGYLFDPDPAVVRAGLVDLAANTLGLRRLDTREEYLVGDAPLGSPFVQAFEILAVLPNNPAEIRAYFRTSPFGQVEIKCRHVPIQAEDVRRKLPLLGKLPATLVYARIAGRTKALVCRRVVSGDVLCDVET
ncbi:MAG: methyltransferase domain-containing protein [Planctomycetota bacterium]|nr:methyltransferase domain-containing protein [Planctomycetota bacterium]